jgi:heptosyltransferase III
LRILIIRPGAIGDALLAFHILKILRMQYADPHITLVSNANVLPLALAFGLVEEVSDYADIGWSELFSVEGIRSPIMQEQLRQTELAICWLRDPKGVVEHNLLQAGVKEVVVAPGRPAEGQRMHVVDYLAGTIGLQMVGDREGHTVPQTASTRVPTAPPDRPRPYNDNAARFPGAFIVRAGVGQGCGGDPWVALKLPLYKYLGGSDKSEPYSSYVAIHPGSGSRHKCWPARNFAAVIAQFNQRNIPVLLLAGPADAERVREILGHLSTQHTRGMLKVLENAPLLEVTDHLQQCRGYLGNDSGITHLSAMLGVPTLALFGPSDPITWRPVGPSVLVLQENPLEQLHINVAIDTMNSFYLNRAR